MGKYADCSPDVEPEEDVDECAGTTNPCGPNTVCTNTVGSYACSCLPGYTTRDDAGCIDINECENKDACRENEECMNTEGSFTCTDVTEDDGCASNPCASNAVCESNQQGQGYTCSCEPSFNGDPYADGCIEDIIVSGFASFFGLSFDTMQSETAKEKQKYRWSAEVKSTWHQTLLFEDNKNNLDSTVLNKNGLILKHFSFNTRPYPG